MNSESLKVPIFFWVPMCCKICVYNCTLKAMGREESKESSMESAA